MTISITEQKWLQVQTAKIIANTLQYEGTVSSDDPKELIEAAVQQYMDSGDPVTKSIILEMLQLAELTGLQLLESTAEDEESDDDEASEDEIDSMIDNLQLDDYINHAYDEDELAVVDSDTGEKIDKKPKSVSIKESVIQSTTRLDELLSRVERIRASNRMARTKTKRVAKERIALKKRQTPEVIKRRARRMAVKAIEKKLARNKPLSALSVSEKERIERIIARRKNVLSRLQMKLIPRIRTIEKDRLTHAKFTEQ